MVKRILRKIAREKLKWRIQAFSALKRLQPYDQLNEKLINDCKIKLEPYYTKYIKEISRADMAASLELASFLYAVCKLNRFHKVLDTGSGFSSFVLRLYAKENSGVQVFSVDDDAAWLEKTKDFLRQHQLDTTNVFTLKQFSDLGEADFDCILHDLNFVEVRIHSVEQMMALAKKNGLVILDDVHKPDYMAAALRVLRDKPAGIFTLKPLTLDRFNRYALAIIKA